MNPTRTATRAAVTSVAVTGALAVLGIGAQLLGAMVAASRTELARTQLSGQAPPALLSFDDIYPLGEMTADQLGQDYDQRPAVIKARWGNRVFNLMGTVQSIQRRPEGVIVQMRGETTRTQVTCVYDPRTPPKATMQPGQYVTIHGRFDGGRRCWPGSDRLTLSNCFESGALRREMLANDARFAGCPMGNQ